jgi:hypothetical protein
VPAKHIQPLVLWIASEHPSPPRLNHGNLPRAKFKPHGNLAPGSAGGRLKVSDWSREWFCEIGTQAGLLNYDLSFGLNLNGGWSPRAEHGLWLRVAGEYSSGELDHFQATLNFGRRFLERVTFLGTLDYLSKYINSSKWRRDGRHSQYGAGLSLDYQVIPGAGIAAYYQHYLTGGKEYGLVGDYEYIDAYNWQHYGHTYAGVRGGGYDEAGLDATYRHPGLNLEAGLTIRKIWRRYEKMLGHAARRESNTGGGLRLGLNNLLESGLNLRAVVSSEFSSRDRLSWEIGFNRRFNPVDLRLSYSEQRNDLHSTDRRITALVSLPLGPAPRSGSQSLVSSGSAVSTRSPFRGQWLRNPVPNMGNPALKVLEEVEQRLEQTLVDLDQISPDARVSQNQMIISGLPGLCCLDPAYTTPASAGAAFSIGASSTSIIVDISKLPKPEYIQAVFKQSDGLYTIIALRTGQGSTKVTSQGQINGVNQVFLEYLKGIVNGLRQDDSKLAAEVNGPGSMYAGDEASFRVEHFLTPGMHANVDIFWEISGPGLITSANTGASVTVSAQEPGDILLTSYVFGLGGLAGFFARDSITITVQERPQSDDDDHEDWDESGDGGGSDDCMMLSEGSWEFKGGGLTFYIFIQESEYSAYDPG